MSRVIYGIHPVEEALTRRPNEVQTLLHLGKERGPLRKLVSRAKALGITVTASTPRQLDELCGSASHQGVAALAGVFAYVELEDLLEQPALRGRTPLIIAADSLTDPQNLGAIFRSAVVLGATGLILPRDRSVHVTPTVVRVSAGATEHLPCALVTNLARALAQLKEAELWVAATVERGGVDPADADLSVPLVLVLGNEHKGIRPLVLKACDLQLTIPSRGEIASLNVSAATTALLYEAARQRRVT
jgi:23S rRNA (guanosine2251-2'-O)-methyltransferase